MLGTWKQDMDRYAKIHKRASYDLGAARIMLQPATLLKVALHHGCFLRFLNCENGTKSHKASHLFHHSLVISIIAFHATYLFPYFQNISLFLTELTHFMSPI